MSHFTLPDCLTDVDPEKVKKSALKKMVAQFCNWKKRLWANYVDAEKQTREFTGPLEKLKDHWDLFLEFKESEATKKRSRKNKINAEKKKHHHVLGPGAYKTGRPKWDVSKEKMIAVGVTPKTLGWPNRCRLGFMRMGESWNQRQRRLLRKKVLKKPRTLYLLQ